jgi:hypothetical protein
MWSVLIWEEIFVREGKPDWQRVAKTITKFSIKMLASHCFESKLLAVLIEKYQM